MKRGSYVNGVSTQALLGETIGENLRRTVEKFHDKKALVSVHQNYRANYQEFFDQTSILAKALLAHGIRKGERVGIWSPNCYEWTLLQYATARIGIILVNLNPAYRAHEVSYAINQSEISMVVSAVSYKTSNYKHMLNLVKEDCPSLKSIIYLGENWEALLDKAPKISDQQLQDAEQQVQFDDAVNIQYTSGTTGFPKGVTLTHHNLINNGYFIAQRLHYSEKDRVCIPVPFYHCFGMVIGNLACTTHGACMVIPNDMFDATKTLEAVQQEKCTSLYGVPTMFISELGLPNFKEYDLSSLRTGVMAGSLCPPEIMKRVQSEMNMKEISICYGMTETSPVSTQTMIGVPFEKQVSTVGTVQDHLEIKIIDPTTGAIVPRGTSGELCTRGYSVMLKYWNDPEKTREVLDDGRWMHTGDMASMDEEGYITITGRIKDLIIRGGENISPKWIEDFLYTHPKIVEVQVIGVPSEKFGEEVMAWVKLHEGVEASGEELKAYCDQKIAHYCIPKYWKFVNNFPMTISGKIRKVEMREISIQELGL
ncbi:AMP-binding protein [Elizabethkingia sp. JS20170427COW]|uniref:AMP-binding protein n=1 Tax=Elizabethkingia sp. JS20170427COW TaxID=2583851 RepID=UPI0011101629|nr:AMP-binding protein [Elizabethkingia sp. JS20170427COW]QCX53529.1 AMP-binding protein [Elizabethkingia sp. JS20170427COW]